MEKNLNDKNVSCIVIVTDEKENTFRLFKDRNGNPANVIYSLVHVITGKQTDDQISCKFSITKMVDMLADEPDFVVEQEYNSTIEAHMYGDDDREVDWVYLVMHSPQMIVMYKSKAGSRKIGDHLKDIVVSTYLSENYTADYKKLVGYRVKLGRYGDYCLEWG